MRKKNKGFSLLEILITLLISGGIVLIFGYLMDKGVKINRNTEKNMDVLNDGLMISEKIYKDMKYSAPGLVAIFPYNNAVTMGDDVGNENITKYGNDECIAVGFPVLPEIYSRNKVTPEETGYRSNTYECIDEMQEKVSKKNWAGYVLYIHDKNGKILGNGETDKNKFYEVRFTYDFKKSKDSKKMKTIMIFERLTMDQWGKELGVSGQADSFNLLKMLLKTNSNLQKQLLSKNIKSFKISKKSYPAFKMRLLLDYGVYGGSNVEGRKAVSGNATAKAENFEVDWVVLPINQ